MTDYCDFCSRFLDDDDERQRLHTKEVVCNKCDKYIFGEIMFKFGDKVRAIKDSIVGRYKKGDVYTFVKYASGWKKDDGIVVIELSKSLDVDNFELASPLASVAYEAVDPSFTFTNDDSIFVAFDDPISCYHKFVNYTGLTETYEYCTKCDIKRS